MARVTIDDSILIELADLIRTNEHSTEKISPIDFKNRFEAIISGAVIPGLNISYIFDNNKPNDAGGVIILLSNNSVEDIDLYWGNNSGILSTHSVINSEKIEVGNGISAKYSYLINNNIIPFEATKLLAVNKNDIKSEYIIPSEKKKVINEKLYSFGIISDTHIGKSSNTMNKLNDCFNYMKDKVSFICHCGDVTDSGKENELMVFINAKSNYIPDIPIYTILGNHDNKTSSYDLKQYMWEYTDGEGMYYLKEFNDDVFIFLSAHSESPAFSTELNTQLSEWVEQYKDKRLFVFEHFTWHVGKGGGEFTTTGEIFDSTNIITTLSAHNNAFVFNGHTHGDFVGQEYSNISNFYNWNGIRSVHLPCLFGPEQKGGASDTNKSQCMIVDVYDNYVHLKGIELTLDKIIPIAEFLIDTNEPQQIRVDLKVLNGNYDSRIQNIPFDNNWNIEIIPNENTSVSIFAKTSKELNSTIIKNNNNFVINNIKNQQNIYVLCNELQNNQIPLILESETINSSGVYSYSTNIYLSQYFEFEDNAIYNIYVPQQSLISTERSTSVQIIHYKDIDNFEKASSSSSYSASNSSNDINLNVNKYSTNSKYFRIKLSSGSNIAVNSFPFIIFTKNIL